MKPPSQNRLALLAAAAILFGVTGAVVLELASDVRLTIEGSSTEGRLVSEAVRHQLETLAREEPQASLAAMGENPRLQQALEKAIANAPSVLSVAVFDPQGIAVAHNVESERGSRLAHQPTLPRPRNFLESFSVLWDLRHPGQAYEIFTQLMVGEKPFASLQVTIAGSFLRDHIRGAFFRGVVVAVIIATLIVFATMMLSRGAVRRLRAMEAGVTAMRTGHFTDLPVDGPDALSGLARGLNLLGEQFRKSERGIQGPVDQSRLLAGIGDTAAGMAHELRGTLQGLTLELDAIAASARKGSHSDVQEHVVRARQRLNHLNRAIGGFLKIARLGPADVRLFDIRELIQELHGVLATDANLAGMELELDPAAESAVILADREVLRQAMENLIRNALQAQPSRSGKITLRSEVNAGTVHISVADSGPGIEPEVLSKVFDPFFTTRKDGSGIGLALVRQTVEMFGGQVTIDSTPGLGAVVGMKLPLHTAP
jgi:signal transduction histidine kinase